MPPSDVTNRDPGINAAILKPLLSGVSRSPSQCNTKHWIFNRLAISLTSKVPFISGILAAFSALAQTLCYSSKLLACFIVASGINEEVKKVLYAGLFESHLAVIRLSAFLCNVVASSELRIKRPRVLPPNKINPFTFSGF